MPHRTYPIEQAVVVVWAEGEVYDVCNSGACVDRIFFKKTGINGSRVVVGGYFEVLRGRAWA